MTPMPEASKPRLSADRPLLLEDTLVLADLAQWPGLRVAYDYAGAPAAGQRRLRLHLGIEPAAVPEPSHPSERPARRDADRQRWDALVRALDGTDIHWSLRCSLDGGAEHPIEAACLRSLATGAAAWFAERAAGRDAPAPVPQTIELPIEPSNPLDLFEWVVELVVQLSAGNGHAPHRVAHRLPPRCTPGAVGQVQQVADLAQAFEAATAEADCLLKLARGHGPGGDDAGAPPPLWVLRLCTQPRGLRWRMQAVRCHAPAPLATRLLSREDVAVPSFDAEAGLNPAASTCCTFTDLSLDELAPSALQGLDQLLAPPLADALTALGQQAGPLPRESRLAGIRRELAAAVAGTLQPVIATDPVDAAAEAVRAEAVSLLRETLLSGVSKVASLGAACQVQVQLQGRLAAPAAGEGGPRLCACIVATESGAAGAVPVRTVAEAHVHLPLQPEPAWFGLLLSPPDRADRTHVLLDLQLRPLSIEWPGDDLPSPARGPRALHLLRPHAAEMQAPELGTVDLPLPLRQPPPVPTIGAQAALPQPLPLPLPLPPAGAAARLAASLGWAYRLDVSPPAAAQDVLQIELVAPSPAPSLTRPPLPAPASHADLLDHLAVWWQLWPRLQPALQAALDAWQARPADAAALQRAQTLAADAVQLLAPLPAAWRDWRVPQPGPSASQALPLPQVTARLSEQRQAAGTESAVVFTYQSNGLEAWCLPPDPAGGYDALRLSATDGAAVERPLQGAALAPQDQAAALALPWRRLTLAGLSIMDCPRFEARSRVQRNAVLLHDDAGRPRPTNAAFVYTTPTASPASPCLPFGDHALAVDVAALSAPPLQPLAHHFERLFEALHIPGQAGAALPRIDLSFARPPGATSLVARQPVLLMPERGPVPSAPPAAAGVPLPQALAKAVQQWVASELPGEGMLELAITWYAFDEPATRPLAHWHGLTLKTADISDLPGATASPPAPGSSPPTSAHPPG